MSKSTISTFQLFERFPDKESARVYFESAAVAGWPRLPGLQGSGADHRQEGRLLPLQRLSARTSPSGRAP